MKRGDRVTLIAGRYIDWYSQVCAKHPYELSANGKWKNYHWSIRNWRKEYDPDIVVRIPKFTVKTVAGDMATVTYEDQAYILPMTTLEVLPNVSEQAA